MITDKRSHKHSIAVISKSSAEGGGASKVAEKLACLLDDRKDIAVHHWVGYSKTKWFPHMRRLWGGKFTRKFYHSMGFFSRLIGLPDFITPEIFNLWNSPNKPYNVYHFHDISSTFSPLAMRWLAHRRPVVWTFHDCSPFTGGCLYPFGCEAFRTRCGKCPQLGTWPLLTSMDFTGFMQDFKRKTALSDLIIPIAPSNWMADEAMKSGMFPMRPQVIPYSVDTDLYKPMDKNSIRQRLGLPHDRFIVLMAVMNIDDPRKGIRFALKALRALEKDVYVIAIGQYDQVKGDHFDGMDTHFTGYIHDEKLMAQYYTAADILLFPSIADNLPNSILESMASGTPVIGFQVGGISDMVQTGVNGHLSESENIAGLVQGLRMVVDSPDLLMQWSQVCRIIANNKFNQKAFLDAHLTLYNQILCNDHPISHLSPKRDLAKNGVHVLDD